MSSNETNRVYSDFDEFLLSRKKFEKSSHGQKLSEKCHEKVNLVQVKKFLSLKSWLNS